MPQEPEYGLPFEAPGDQPGISLTGGASGTEDILAEAVATELTRIDAAAAALASRVATLEAAVATTRWRTISTGTRGGGDFTLAVPAGFSRLRLSLSGQCDITGFVFLRINDNLSSLHRYGFWGIDAEDDGNNVPELIASEFNVDRIQIAEFGTIESNTCMVDIFPADGAQNPSVEATSARISDDPNVNRRMFAWGKLTSDVAVSSLVIIDETSFVDVRWWLEGYLAA